MKYVFVLLVFFSFSAFAAYEYASVSVGGARCVYESKEKKSTEEGDAKTKEFFDCFDPLEKKYGDKIYGKAKGKCVKDEMTEKMTTVMKKCCKKTGGKVKK